MNPLSAFLPPAFRSSDTVGATPGPADNFWYSQVGASSTTKSGVTVNTNRALTLAVYWACLRNISEDVAKLPVAAYRATAPRTGSSLPSKIALPKAPAQRVLMVHPGQEMGGSTLREVLTAWALGWGNGYAEIIRNNRGAITDLCPIHPSRVIPKRKKSGTIITPEVDLSANDDIVYQVRPPIGDPQASTVTFAKEDIFHLKGFAGGDGLVGYSALQYAAQALGIGIAAQEYGASFFGGGSVPTGVLTHPGKMSDTAVNELNESWIRKFAGKARIATLREGMKYQQISIPPEEAQFLQTRIFAIQDICRFFRMPLGKVQEDSHSTFSNVEQKNQEYVDDTLVPWLSRWEEEASLKLDLAEGEFLKFDVKGLLRGDHNSRANYFRTMFNLGAMSPNEIRVAEDMDPIDQPEMDEYYIQTNMAGLEEVAEGEVEPASGGNGQPPKPELDDAEDKPANGHGRLMPASLASLFNRVRRWRF